MITFKLKRNSLFIKLLGGFISVILILLSFNLFSFAYFSENIQDEVIKYNRQNVEVTAERYDNHIRIVQSTIARLYFNPKVVLLSELANSEQFEPVNLVVEEIRNILNNELLFLDNVVMQFGKNNFVIDKHGPGRTDETFSRIYTSPDYGPAFWTGQLNGSETLELFPQSSFSDGPYNRSGSYMPLVLRNKLNDALYIAVLLDAGKMFRSFHNSIDKRFYVLNAQGKLLYRSTDEELPSKLADKLMERSDYFKLDNSYYFYTKGATGLTYMNVISDDSLAQEASRLKVVLLAVLSLAAAMSVAVSVVVSVGFHTPVRNIIDTIEEANPDRRLRSKIDEFNFIHDKIKGILRLNRDIHDDLNDKTDKLRHVGFINKLKNIYSADNELADTNKPFYLVLFRMTLTRQFHQTLAVEPKRAAFLMKEYIDASLSEQFPDTITLQAEQDEIMTIVFTDEPAEQLIRTLESIKGVFDRDRAYCLLTIAFHPELHEPTGFTAAYEMARAMVQQRKLNGEAELILDYEPQQTMHIGFMPAQEREFAAHLQAGNEAAVLDIVKRALYAMEKRNSPAAQYVDFAKEATAKTMAALIAMKHDISGMFEDRSPYEDIQSCASIGDFTNFFEAFLGRAVALVQRRKEESHPVKQLMLDYLNRHYHEDISLETVADRLNMSPGYMSKQFKEQTGMNFSEYVNELRMQKAKELLQSSDCKIQEVAERVGYFNVNSFIRMFKKTAGLPPGEFRRLHRFGDGEGADGKQTEEKPGSAS
ncbi:helix-turn-helix transcriptional regulator [Paenibacillus hodogayensis]|uniref:Helix-turn-helix transcriptional regulator n=1 Tax=Paenibacillus hodogayensis TaxID=279208 RepID=A0ABV5VPA6_9BACL